MSDKMREAIIKILKGYKQEMERYGYYGSNPGVSVDDFDDIANEIVAWQAAQAEQSAELERLRNRVARAERDLSVVMAEGHRLMCDFQEQVRKTCAALKRRNDAEQERDALREEAERLRKDVDAPSSVEWPKHWVDQHVEPKTLHKPVLVPLEVLIRTEFELTHSERGGDYDTKILGILRDIIAQADAAIAAGIEERMK